MIRALPRAAGPAPANTPQAPLAEPHKVAMSGGTGDALSQAPPSSSATAAATWVTS